MPKAKKLPRTDPVKEYQKQLMGLLERRIDSHEKELSVAMEGVASAEQVAACISARVQELKLLLRDVCAAHSGTEQSNG